MLSGKIRDTNYSFFKRTRIWSSKYMKAQGWAFRRLSHFVILWKLLETFSLQERVIGRPRCVRRMLREVEGYGGDNLEVNLLWSVAVWGGTLCSTLILQSFFFLKCPSISGSALVLIMQSKGPAAPAVLGGGSGSRALSAVGWLLWVPGRYGYLGVRSM